MLLIRIIYIASNYKKAFFGLKSLKDNPVIIYIANYCLAGGTPVNVVNKEEFLSSILKSAEVDRNEMEVYAVDEEIGTLEFPELRKWKAVSLCL